MLLQSKESKNYSAWFDLNTKNIKEDANKQVTLD